MPNKDEEEIWIEMRRAEEMKNPLQWWWLSFADVKFNGAIIIEAHGIIDAVHRAHVAGINPGGQVAAMPIEESKLPKEEYRNRLLLSRDEVQAAFPGQKIVSQRELNAERRN